MRVNIGCGMTPTLGYRNFDNSWSITLSSYPWLASTLYKLKFIGKPQLNFILFCKVNCIEWANATKNIPLPDESVDVLYSSHMIEHLDRSEASSFLNEAKRILKKSGKIRLAVPDIEKKIEAYNHGKDADIFIEYTHMCVPRPRNRAQRLRMALIGPRHHQWMYDGRSLSRLLQEQGFSNPIVLPPGETTISEPGKLDLREREDKSLYVEAIKG